MSVIILVGLAGCGGGGDGETPPPPPPSAQYAGSCRVQGAGYDMCTDYVGTVFTRTGVQSGCSGTFQEGHCLAAGLTGSCAISPSSVSASVIYYYPPTTLDAAQLSCSTGAGTFTLGSVASCAGTSGASVAHGNQEQRTRYQATTVPYGSTCVSEVQQRTCANGTWGAWSGTYTAASCTVQAGSCSGTAMACSGMGQTACGAHSGCTWLPASCQATSTGFGWNCSNFTTVQNAQTVCNGIPGCYWSSNACQGGVQSCSLKSQPQCATLKSQGFSCDWLSACTGTPSSCGGFISPTACAAQAGCSWH